MLKEVAMLMGFEATRDLPLEEVEIETPMCKTRMNMLKGEDTASCLSSEQDWDL